jgi:hypothetical protein
MAVARANQCNNLVCVSPHIPFRPLALRQWYVALNGFETKIKLRGAVFTYFMKCYLQFHDFIQKYDKGKHGFFYMQQPKLGSQWNPKTAFPYIR